jgi:predicted DNA-binding protein
MATEDQNDEQPRRLRGRQPPQLVHARINRETFDRLQAYTARTGATNRAVMNAALDQYLDRSSDTALILRRLDRLTRGIGRSHRQNDTLAEFLAAYVHIWFAHTTSIGPEQQKAARQSADRRYAEMIEFLRRRISGSKRVLVDLLGTDEADELVPDVVATKGARDGLAGE